MTSYNQHIELINNYFNNSLSQEAKINFESKLGNDAEFNAIYEEHLVFVNGLSRIEIKDDILKAKRTFRIEKWLKISGISMLIIGVLTMLFTLAFNTSEIEPASNNDNLNTIILDSIPSKDSKIEILGVISEGKIDTSKITSQIDVNYTTTSVRKKHGSVVTTKRDLTKRSQVIRINVAKDTTIRCKEGTILKITKGSFINPNTKKTITGTIDLKITEYYKLSDMLQANLSTVSSGKQLETGGMLYLEATQNDTKLELKDNSPIEISFPNQNQKPGMQLFSGEWKDDNINWKLQTDDVDNLEILEENIEVPFAVVDQVPTFPGCENDDNEIRKKCTTDAISQFINQNFNTEVGLGLGLTGKQRILSVFKIDHEGNVNFIQSRGVHPRLSEEADRVIALLPKMTPGMQRGISVAVSYSLPITFEIAGKQELTGSLINAVIIDTSLVVNPNNFKTIEIDTVFSSRRGIVETIREVMHDKDFEVDSLFANQWRQYNKQKLIRKYGVNKTRRFILRKSLFEMKNTKFKILEDDSITRGGHVIRTPWDETKIPTTTRVMNLIPIERFSAGTETVTAKEFEARLEDLSDTTISSRDASYYVLKSSNLGWINCDRFINGRTKRIKYKLNIKSVDDVNISMVFKSLNSILPSWYTNGVYDFQEVGYNEDIVLVAIKRKGGKLYYDAVDTKTEKNPQIDFKFSEVSVEELKQELEKLNSNFN